MTSLADAEGWPELRTADPPVDQDIDGLPDTWENENGLNPKDGEDARDDADGDGYTEIEEYLNGTDPRSKTEGTDGGVRP